MKKKLTIIFSIKPLLNSKSSLFTSIINSKVLVLVSATGEIKVIIPFFFNELEISIFAFFPNFIEMIPLCMLGIMGSIGHYFLSQAAKNAEVVIITPFEYSSFIFVTLLGYIFYNEIPDASIYIGILLISISGVYIVYREHKKLR